MNKFIRTHQKALPYSNYCLDSKYVLDFNVTNYCNDKCAHCFEGCGPHRQQIYIPESVIYKNINQALRDSDFSKMIRLTGGEVLTAHKKVRPEYNISPNYVSNILNFCKKHDILASLETNAIWAADEAIRESIVDYLAEYGNRFSADGFASQFQIGLSLDKWHNPQTVINIERALMLFAKKKQNCATFSLAYFNGQEYLLEEFKNYFKQKHNVKFKTMDSIQLMYFYHLPVILYGPLDLMNPKDKNIEPYSISIGDDLIAITLHNDGTARLGDFSTEWKIGKKYSTLKNVKNDLMNKLFIHEIENNLK